MSMRNRLKYHLNNQNGSIAAVMVICIAMVVFSVYVASMYISNSNKEVEYLSKTQAKQELFSRLSHKLDNDFLVNYSLKNCSSVDNNPDLKQCILSGIPTVSKDCDNIKMEFCEPTTAGPQIFSGTTDKPKYMDVNGNDCNIANPDNNCFFKAIVSCSFTCPGNQESCGLVKIMSCSLALEHYRLESSKFFQLAKKENLMVSIFSVRLSNDLKTLSAVR